MTKSVLLNNVDHKDLKVITARSARFGDNVGHALTFPSEFVDVQREYPILFRKSPDAGKFQAFAIFGFDSNENLFLSEAGWDARYTPAVIEKGPFIIGLHRTTGNARPGIMVNIDLDDPRVNQDEGERLFKEFGGNSVYLDRIRDVLRVINDGVQMSEGMFTAFEALELLEPVAIEYTLNNGEVHRFEGYHTINNGRLSKLSSEEVFSLHRTGALRAAYLAVASLGNIRKLIDMKNARL